VKGKAMIKAGFDILWIIASADKEVADPEVDVIHNYLLEQYGDSKGVFDLATELKELTEMDKPMRMERYLHSLEIYKNSTGKEERLRLLNFIFELIWADKKIAKEEARLFEIMGQVWQMNVKDYMRSVLGG